MSLMGREDSNPKAEDDAVCTPLWLDFHLQASDASYCLHKKARACAHQALAWFTLLMWGWAQRFAPQISSC